MKEAEVDRDFYCNGRADAFEEVLLEIDSLQQGMELPEKYQTPDWLFEERGQPVEGLDAEMFKEWGTTKEEYLAKSMDKVHLEMEIATYLQDWEDDDEIGLHLSTDEGCMPIELEDVRDLARHFYELGCRRIAVMYDDIEYERQRAEEAEQSVECLDDSSKTLEQPPKMNVLTWKDIIDIEQILNQVRYEHNCGIGEESFGKEVLERFLEQRDELLEQSEDDVRNADAQDKVEKKPRYCIPRYWDGQYDQSELFKEQSVEGLEEAAEKYTNDSLKNLGAILRVNVINAFKTGAKWDRAKMLEGAVETEVVSRLTGSGLLPSVTFLVDDSYKEGDKVRVIVIPEEK